MNSRPTFSIVVPTRSRPLLLRRALASIADQTWEDFEVLVVDDGSSGEDLEAMRQLSESLDRRFRFVWRAPEEPEHGPAIARTVGLGEASGKYVGFLDDDDYWSDSTHLATAAKALDGDAGTDLYIANQVATRNQEVLVPSWLPSVDRCVQQRQPVMSPDVFRVSRSDLMQPGGIGFAHVNMCFSRREIATSLGGFWPPCEEDLDWFLRLVDASERILYRPTVVSVNTVRADEDPPGVSSIGTKTRILIRLAACQHALLECRQVEVRAYAKLLLAGTLRTLAKHAYVRRRFRLAADCAAQATAVDPSPRWRLISLYLRARSIIAPVDPPP